ncbi:MAG: hypothetical protein WCA35_18065 [Kovacikia sp.]
MNYSIPGGNLRNVGYRHSRALSTEKGRSSAAQVIGVCIIGDCQTKFDRQFD